MLCTNVGRFVQFTEYRTYNDPRSIDHCQLSVEVLQKAGILDILEESEKQYIEDYSQEVLDGILTGKRIDYQLLKSLNDMKLCFLRLGL